MPVVLMEKVETQVCPLICTVHVKAENILTCLQSINTRESFNKCLTNVSLLKASPYQKIYFSFLSNPFYELYLFFSYIIVN